MRGMHSPARSAQLVRRLAWACALLALAIASLSAFIRLSRTGLGCEPWPACLEQRAAAATPQALDALDPPAVTSARIAHRVIASVALLVVVALLMETLARQPPLRDEGRVVLALLAVSLALAVLGRMAGPARTPAVVLGNLLGGFALVALSWRLAVYAGRPAANGPPRTWTLAALLLLLAQAGLGGFVSATHQAGQCTAGGACLVHAVGALATAAVLLPLVRSAWKGGARVPAAAITLLFGAQATQGLLMGRAAPDSLAGVLVHNLGAVLLLAAVASLLPMRRSGA
jgi:heme a synthase